MLKDKTYQEKFAILKSWLTEILTPIKKDLKKDHLSKDNAFFKHHFGNKNLQKLSVQDLVLGYTVALENEDIAEHLGEFISNRWLLKHTEIYYFFEKELTAVSKEFYVLDELDTDASETIVSGAIKEFGAEKTYLFSVLNSVVFPKKIYDELKKKAERQRVQEAELKQIAEEAKSIEQKEMAYQQEIARLKDRYEKKLQGMQKKYHTDVTALKKQISNLQIKLNKGNYS